MTMKFVKFGILSLLLLPMLAQAGDDGKAMIITSGEKPAECISAVHVNQIDGKEVKVQKNGFDIDPGQHTLTARAIVNTSFCKAMGPATGQNQAAPLEMDFKAGKTYYLGYDHSSPLRKDWKLVVWKVEG